MIEKKKLEISRRQAIRMVLAGVLTPHAALFARAQEPITFAGAAAFVGLALLEGAISYVGGKLMSSALGDPSIIDVRSWIQYAVAELKAFVSEELRRQLDAKVMEQMRADLEAINTDLYHYAALKPQERKSNRYLIENCDLATARLLPLSLNYDQALFITTSAMAFRLYTLYALFELDRSKGHITSVRPMMDDFVKQANAIKNRVGTQMSPDAHFQINCTIVGETKYTCIGLKDGVAVTPPYSAPEKICRPNRGCRDSFDVMREDIKRSWAPQTESMQKQADEFVKSADSSIRLAVDCYDKMCRRIGDRYVPPKEVSDALKNKIKSVPPIVTMPGAIVVRSN